MPIIIAIIAVVILVGASLYFFTENDTTSEPAVTIEEIMGEPFVVPTESMQPETPEVPSTDPVQPDTPVVTNTEPSREATQEIPLASGGGTFTAAVSYLTPARTSHDMDVTLTVDASGIITAASIVYDNGAGFSNAHQERFDGAYTAMVIGQPIDSVSLARVGGASLTTSGFNDAVAKIRAERG